MYAVNINIYKTNATQQCDIGSVLSYTSCVTLWKLHKVAGHYTLHYVRLVGVVTLAVDYEPLCL